MKKLILILLFINIFSLDLISQEVVVSELFYGAGPANEWTELLVVQDNISLVGYSLRDNSGMDGWQGGIRFKNVDLWKNLRAGTIIVIYHRGGVIDDNKSDGYIEMGAQSSYYFDTFLHPGQNGDWDVAGSMDLNSSYDMIQIRNNLDQHVHCLGYIGGQLEDNYDTIPKPNIFLNSGITQNNSVKVAPGLDLSAYRAGIAPSQIIGTGPVTKGLPNKRNTGENINQLFWRELRQPVWNNPGIITTKIVNDFQWVELKWNAASTFSDPNEGYMIVRYVDNNNTPLQLEDGKIYNVGQILSAVYTVVGYVETLTKTEFIDKFENSSFECGRKYGYQVYAYRYRQSDNEPQMYDYPDVKNARGRQYNETVFASVAQAIIKEIPPIPIITTSIGATQFCSNVDARLESNIKDVTKYTFQWYSTNDGAIAGDGAVLNLTKEGDYWVEITDKSSGCTSISNNILIEILEAPEAIIFEPVTNKTYTNDTTINVCKGENLNLRGLSIPSGSDITFKWTKDGIDYSINNNIVINLEGVYKFISTSGGICPDTSISVTVNVIEPDFSLSDSYLEFDADNSSEKDIIITNNSDSELIINSNDIILTPANNFKIISPTVYPIKISPKGNTTIKIRFEIIGFGERTGRLTINTLCNYSKITDLKGIRQNIGATRLDPDRGLIDFGLISGDCINLYQTIDSIKFVSSGIDNMVVYLPELNSPVFRYNSPVLDEINNNINVKPGESFMVYVEVFSNLTGVHNAELKVPYLISGKSDTSFTLVQIKADIYKSSISLSPKSIDLSSEITCKKTLDTFFVVTNNSRENIIIEKDFQNPNVSITSSLPLNIDAGLSDTLFVRFVFSGTSPFNINLSYLNPCELLSENINILPPTEKFDVVFEKDTIDFGIINNCETMDDVVISTFINSSKIGGKIGSIIYNGTNIESSLYKDKELNEGNNGFDIKILSNASGNILDSIVFFVEPCNEQYTLYVKGVRINPEKPVFSTSSIDFGTDNIFVPSNSKLTVLNENSEFDIVIESLNVPMPFELISHTVNDFPIRILPNQSIELEFDYKRLEVGSPIQLIKVKFQEPCVDSTEIVVRGVTIDDRRVQVKAILPPKESIELGKEKKIPVVVEFDNHYNISDIELRNLKFYFSYDFQNINIRTAITGTSINSPSSVLNFDDSQAGKLILTLNVTEPNKVSNGELIILTVRPLLGDKLISTIILDSLIINSKIPTAVETNESEITIFGDCDLEGRLISVDGKVSIAAREIESGASIRVDYSVVSHENSTIELYNNDGVIIDKLLNRIINPGDYSLEYSTSNLTSGIYWLVLKNGIKHKTISLPVVK